MHQVIPTAAAIDYPSAGLDTLAALEDHHFWFGARRQILIDAIARHFAGARDYLELGAGTGYNARGIAAALPDLRTVSSDPISGPLYVDACDVPFENAYDLIGMYDVLEHIADDARALRQIHNALRPDGGLLLTVPQHPALWSPADTHAHHHRRYTARRLTQLLRAAGFEILGRTSFQTSTLPFFATRTLALRMTGRAPAPKSPPAPLNSLFAALMAFDGALIRAGIPLPLGASLLIAAKKPPAVVLGVSASQR